MAAVPASSAVAAPHMPVVNAARPEPETDRVAALRGIAAETGQSYLALLRGFLGLAFGPGKIGFREYLALRLFDPALAPSERARFVGSGAGLVLGYNANFRRDWHRLVSNKISASAYLAAFGFPTLASLAVYGDKSFAGSPGALRSRAELRDFLRRAEHYPLFGKPVDAFQSLGSASMDRVDLETDRLVLFDGRESPVETYIDEIAANYSDGYMFQRRASPHQDVRAICGDRLATVRVLTIMGEDGPEVFRACWKIPGAANAADNFWRSGNLLARLDLDTGEVLRVVQGVGSDQEDCPEHPDTGARIVGSRVPDWDRLLEVARHAASLFGDLGLLGWDIAPTDDGPVIVEVNETPDLLLNQIADGRGILDERFLHFVRERRICAARHAREVKRVNRSTLAQV